jgi:hypothetical protein
MIASLPKTRKDVATIPWHTVRVRCWSSACEHRFQIHADAYLVSCSKCHRLQRPDPEPLDEIWAVFFGDVAA